MIVLAKKRLTKISLMVQDNGFTYTGLLKGQFDTPYSSQNPLSSIQVVLKISALSHIK